MVEELLDTLPARPLTIEEVKRLSDGCAESIAVAPGSAVTTTSGPVVPILHITLFDEEESRYVGFDQETESWERIDTWTKENWDQTEIEETIKAWGIEQFGEEFVEHRIVDEHGVRE